MTKYLKLYQKTVFWQKVKDSVAILGPGTEITLLANEAALKWHYVTLVAGILVYLIGIWMVDHDNNGVVDLFESK